MRPYRNTFFEKVLPRSAGNVAYILEKSAAQLWLRSPNVNFEDILSKKSNRCPRVFEMKHQLIWCTSKIWYHNFFDDFLSHNKQKAIFAWKTGIFICTCYHFLNSTEDFYRRLNLWIFSRFNLSFAFQPLERGIVFQERNTHYGITFWTKKKHRKVC